MSIFTAHLATSSGLCMTLPKRFPPLRFVPGHAIPLAVATLLINLISTPVFTAAATSAPPGEDVSGIVSVDSSESSAENMPGIAIFAVNPGYTEDVGKDSGEFIELVNLSGQPFSLAGYKLFYYNSSEKETVLYEFPDGSEFIGEKILLRYEKSPEAADKAQDDTYADSLAMSGSLKLVSGETTLSSACWAGASTREDCLPVFSTTVKSRYKTTIVRQEDGTYQHANGYLPEYDAENPGLFLPEEDESADDATGGSGDSQKVSQCKGLKFTEILTYYADSPAEQFIEIYNPTAATINLQGCQLKYKNKKYDFPLSEIAANAYYSYRPANFTLTKNPTKEGTVELLDTTSEIIDVLIYPHGQKKQTAYALISENGIETWRLTYAPTPGSVNVYQKFRTCEEGKVINELTGNCVNASKLSTALTDCPAGKYRNPATGRCKTIEEDSSTECKEGYERNPETNRCRKIKQNNGADYAVVPVTGGAEKSSFIALWTIGAVASLGAVYVIFQFRRELRYKIKRLLVKLPISKH